MRVCADIWSKRAKVLLSYSLGTLSLYATIISHHVYFVKTFFAQIATFSGNPYFFSSFFLRKKPLNKKKFPHFAWVARNFSRKDFVAARRKLRVVVIYLTENEVVTMNEESHLFDP